MSFIGISPQTAARSDVESRFSRSNSRIASTGIADTLGQLQVAWTATLTAPALQGLGAHAPALRELVLVEHAAIAG